MKAAKFDRYLVFEKLLFIEVIIYIDAYTFIILTIKSNL